MSVDAMSDMELEVLRAVAQNAFNKGIFEEFEAGEILGAIARLDAAERERDELREALDSIAVYGDDTLSGPVSEAAYRHWHRDGVRVMRDRARAALTANHSAPVVEG